MIIISKQRYKQLKTTDPKLFYKKYLQGQLIINPILGNILFTQLGLGETIHRTKRNLRPFICLLKELVESGTCDGKLEPLYKPRKDRIKGFYHIKNTVKLSFIKIALDILIGEDQDGKKYYMFKKDPQGYLGEGLTSQRGPSESNIIITENDQNVKEHVAEDIEKDFKDIKIGDVFWLGDSMRIEVIDILPTQQNKDEDVNTMKFRKLKEELQKYLENIPNGYVENLAKAEEFCTYYICPELKKFAKDYCNKKKGLYGPNFDKIKFEMLDSYCSFTNLNLLSLDAGELIDKDKQAFLKRLKADVMNNLEKLFNECCKKLEEHLGFKCIEEIICDSNGNFAELGIVLGGPQLYGKE